MLTKYFFVISAENLHSSEMFTICFLYYVSSIMNLDVIVDCGLSDLI